MKLQRIRKAALWIVSCVIVASIAAVFIPVSPSGRFSTPQVGNAADAYLEFSDGKAAQIVFGGERGREGPEYRRVFGDYGKERGHWVLVTDSGMTGQISATLLSLTITYDTGSKDGPFYRYEIYKGR